MWWMSGAGLLVSTLVHFTPVPHTVFTDVHPQSNLSSIYNHYQHRLHIHIYIFAYTYIYIYTCIDCKKKNCNLHDFYTQKQKTEDRKPLSVLCFFSVRKRSVHPNWTRGPLGIFARYADVFFVPGNHDLWAAPCLEKGKDGAVEEMDRVVSGREMVVEPCWTYWSQRNMVNWPIHIVYTTMKLVELNCSQLFWVSMEYQDRLLGKWIEMGVYFVVYPTNRR